MLHSQYGIGCSTRWYAHIPQQAMEGDGTSLQGPVRDKMKTKGFFSQNAKAAQSPTDPWWYFHITKFVYINTIDDNHIIVADK